MVFDRRDKESLLKTRSFKTLLTFNFYQNFVFDAKKLWKRGQHCFVRIAKKDICTNNFGQPIPQIVAASLIEAKLSP